jgi:hypothetical protein
MTKTETNSEMKNEVLEWTLYRIAKVNDFLEMWQGSQNQCATLKVSDSSNKQMPAVEYILDREEIVNASSSLFQCGCTASLKLLERLLLPTAFSAKGPPWRTTSAKNISTRAEWLRHSGRARSEPSETPRWRNTPRPASIRRVALHIALRLPFRRFFSLCRSAILSKHSGVVANCDHTTEWVHWVHACIGIAMGNTAKISPHVPST